MYKLRPHQSFLIDRIYAEFRKGNKRVLLMAPTGAGKTVIAKHLIDSGTTKGSRCLFTVPRINLIEQTAKRFNPEKTSIIQGDDPRFDDSKPIQIATIQTLMNRELSPVDFTIFDEIHYSYEGIQIQSIFERFPKSLFLGMSATPVDERGYLLEGWDAIIDDIQIQDVIDAGYLVPLENYTCLNLDLSSVHKKGGEYVEKEVEPIVTKTPILQSVLDNYVKYAKGKKFICFAVNKKHGLQLTELFNKAGFLTAFVNADTPMNLREQYYSDFHTGKLIGLVNIEILTAGYDEETIECVICATPVGSWRKYIQLVGRGVRLFGLNYAESCKNGKSKCIYLDCGNTIQEHGLATDRKKLIFKTKISRIIDRELGIDTNIQKRDNNALSEEKTAFLRRIGSLLDLYEGKVYKKENELQEDVNSFLDKTGWFWWRQNSGKMYKDGRWIHFASKSGLPDCTLFFNNTPIFIGIELKLPTGTLTTHQRQTLPEMVQKRCLIYFAQSVYDVWCIIKHVEQNLIKKDDGIFISDNIYKLPEHQVKYYKKYLSKLLPSNLELF